jgi:nucleoside-diphosphate-sugar epimerase
MAPLNILITGASGYLGGTLLDQLATTNLPTHGKLYALVRNDKQAEAVKKYGAEPLSFDPYDKAAVEQHILSSQISIVFWLIDAGSSTAQPYFIDALSKLKQHTNQPVHFLHVREF